MAHETQNSAIFAPVLLVWIISIFVSVPSGTVPKPVAGGENATLPVTSGGQSLSARLWEDPLELGEALEFHEIKANEQIPGKSDEERGQDARATNVTEVADKLALFVPLRGLNFSENAEYRRRQRYAAQAAMWCKGYNPTRRDGISRVRVKMSEIFGNPPGKLEPPWFLNIPWEQYEKITLAEAPSERTPKLVRIFYVNIDLLQHALRNIHNIALACGVGHWRLATTSPPSTDWLREMLSEGSKGDIYGKATIDVFNTQATGDSSEFIDPESGARLSEAHITINDAQAHLHACIHELIEPDSVSIESVLRELTARGINIGGDAGLQGGPSSMAIVTEWETLFGQQFAEKTKTIVGKSSSEYPNVLVYKYLRGLDGQSPFNRKTGSAPEITLGLERIGDAKSASEALSRVFELPPLPKPEGKYQFDYLARLGQQLSGDDEMRRRLGHGMIRAIGLISTDVEDKLALLKVLRPRFPEALFFTNEMEADFLQPENTKYTRNLIVSSRYSLAGEEIVGDGSRLSTGLPVFRSSTQVALVDSIWAALNPKLAQVRQASLREIGLRASYLLNQVARPGDAQASAYPGRESLATGSGSGGALADVQAVARSRVEKVGRWWSLHRIPGSTFYFCLLVMVASVFLAFRFGRGPRASAGAVLPKKETILWWEKALRALLGRTQSTFEFAKLQEVFEWKPVFFEAPDHERTEAEAQNWWIVSLIFALWGFTWWLALGPWSTVALLASSLLALVFFCLRLRFDPKALWALAVSALCLVAVLVLYRAIEDLVLVEPLAVADGVCIWPAIVLRLASALVSFCCLRPAWGDLCRVRDACTRRFFLERRGDAESNILDRSQPPVRPLAQFPSKDALVARYFPAHHRIAQGTNPDAASHGSLRENSEAFEWLAYLRRTYPLTSSFLRDWVSWTLGGLLLAGVLMASIGFPTANTRGNLTEICDSLSLLIALVGLALVGVFVGHELWECRCFLERIWGHGTTAYGLEMEEALALVARLTEGVGNLITYPFAICFILLCAHFSLFEQWRGLAGLYAILGLALGALLLLTYQMQQVAQQVRSKTVAFLQLSLAEALWLKRLVLQRPPEDAALPGEHVTARSWWIYTIRRLGNHLNLPEMPRLLTEFEQWQSLPFAERTFSPESRLHEARLADVAFHEARIHRMERLIKLFAEFREGAFGGWYSNPILRALLIPGAGLGSIELIQKLMT